MFTLTGGQARSYSSAKWTTNQMRVVTTAFK
jgi:hypothetical protein